MAKGKNGSGEPPGGPKGKRGGASSTTPTSSGAWTHLKTASDFVERICDKDILSIGQARLLQRDFDTSGPRVQSDVYKGLAGRLTSSTAEDYRLIAKKIRAALRSWDAMVICADLAAIPATETGNPIHVRMHAIAREPFFWDERIRSIDLSLYERSERLERRHEADGDVALGARAGAQTLSLQHCYAVRLPADLEERAALESDGAGVYGPTYSANLRKYMEKWGSSIDLDGHVGRDPRYAASARDEIGLERRDLDLDAEVFVSKVDPDFSVEISAEVASQPIPGSDASFISEVVEESLGLDITGEPVIHFMEGIDKNFSDDRKRFGITAHMFIVYKEPQDVQEPGADLVRNLQLLLLRFCAYYMDEEAEKKQKLANEEQARANKIAETAQTARKELLDKANKVRESIKQLSTLADEMEASMQDNPEVSRFILWLRDMRPLFNTGQPLVLPGLTREVRGNHNTWTRDHLAAALWSFTRPERPSFLQGSDLGASDLWNYIMSTMGDEERQSRIERMIVHRHGIFDALNKLKPEDLNSTFSVMKRWNNALGTSAIEDVFREGSAKSTFFLSQIMFLLGQPSFKSLEDTKPFTFVSQTMLEGLIHFASGIDRGFHDDKMQPTLRYLGRAPSLIGGITNCEIAISEENDPSDKMLGKDHLIVRITQDEALALRDLKKEDDERQERGNVAAGNLRNLLNSLGTRQAPIKKRNDSEEKYQKSMAEWREKLSKAGKQETSSSLAKTLGLTEKYNSKKRSANPEERTVSFYAGVEDIAGLPDPLTCYSYVDLPPDEGASIDIEQEEDTVMKLASVRCDANLHQYEFRFRAKTDDLKFTAEK